MSERLHRFRQWVLGGPGQFFPEEDTPPELYDQGQEIVAWDPEPTFTIMPLDGEELVVGIYRSPIGDVYSGLLRVLPVPADSVFPLPPPEFLEDSSEEVEE